MQSFLKVKRDLLFGGFNAEYSLESAMPADKRALIKFAQGFLGILPPEILKGRDVINIKGRDSNNLIKGKINHSFLPLGDEYLYIAGTLKADPAEPGQNPEDEDDTASDEGAEFFISVNSKFARFIGNRDIAHQTILSTGGGLPEDFRIRDLNPELPLHAEVVRAGFDLFDAHRFSFVGLAPQVTQTFLFEADPEGISIRIVAERLKTAASLPLERDALLERLNTLLITTLGINLAGDYRSKIGG